MLFIFTVITRFAVKGVTLVTFLLLANLLSLTDFSKYGFVFTTTLLIAVFFDFGLRNSAAYFIGQNPEWIKNIVTIVITYITLICILIAIVTCILIVSGVSSYSTSEIIASSIILFGLFAIRTLQGILLGTHNVRYINTSDILQKVVLFFSVVVAFAYSSTNIEIIFWGFALSTVVTIIYLASRVFNINTPKPQSSNVTLTTKLFGRGLVFMVGAFGMIAYKKIGFYVADYYGGESIGGIYFGVNRFAEVITEVGVAVSMVLFSRNISNKDRKKSIDEAAKSTRVCIFVLIFLGLCLGVFAAEILKAGLGGNFGEYQTLYRVALCAAVTGLVPTIMFPTLTVIYAPIKVATLYVLAVIFNISLSSVLFISLGVVGIALSLLISNLILSVIIMLYLRNNEATLVKDFLLIKLDDLRFFKKFTRKFSRK